MFATLIMQLNNATKRSKGMLMGHFEVFKNQIVAKAGIYFQTDLHFLATYNYVVLCIYTFLGSPHVSITCVHVDVQIFS